MRSFLSFVFAFTFAFVKLAFSSAVVRLAFAFARAKLAFALVGCSRPPAGLAVLVVVLNSLSAVSFSPCVLGFAFFGANSTFSMHFTHVFLSVVPAALINT